MHERFKVVCIPCKALYKCSAFVAYLFICRLLRHVQADADAAASDEYYSMSSISLTAAVLTAQHIYTLSRRIKSNVRHQLKSSDGFTSITVDGY